MKLIFNAIIKNNFNNIKIAEGLLKLFNSKGELLLSLNATSGGFGKGCIPAGKARVLRPIMIPFDRVFKGKIRTWYARIVPVGLLNVLLAKLKRNGFLLHVDNAPHGTLGCIAVKPGDDEILYQALCKAFDGLKLKYIELEIVYR